MLKHCNIENIETLKYWNIEIFLLIILKHWNIESWKYFKKTRIIYFKADEKVKVAEHVF